MNPEALINMLKGGSPGLPFPVPGPMMPMGGPTPDALASAISPPELPPPNNQEIIMPPKPKKMGIIAQIVTQFFQNQASRAPSRPMQRPAMAPMGNSNAGSY